jgi:hypothetical protein
MKNNIINPKSLIQIHYHNRTSGVLRVIDEYASTFQRISESSITKNFLICNNVQKIRSSNIKEIISIPDCDYHKFLSKKSVTNKYEKIFQKINCFLTGHSVQRPLCIVGHNLSLGKNIALSIAFSLLASKHKKAGDINFFSVIHDLAEEGRLNILHNLLKIESLGISIWKYLYPQTNVHFIVLNKRNYTLFKNAGYSVFFLPNPLNISDKMNKSAKLGKNKIISIQNALSAVSKIDRTNFDKKKKTYFYPVRVISRKNVLEAVIMACLICKGNLIVGGYGTSRKDIRLFNEIIQHARQNNLPVILNVERIKNHVNSNFFEDNTVFEYLYKFSNFCITTSLVEGFGYALYEPWIYGKNVIGRLPQGVGCSEIIDLTHLYDRLDIPISWISLGKIGNKYYFQLKRFFSGDSKFLNPEHFKNFFKKSYLYNNFFDFGALTLKMQFSLLNKLCLTGDRLKMKVTIKNRVYDISKFKNLQKNISDTPLLSKNRKIIKNLLGEKIFDREFKRCFFSNYSFTDISAEYNRSLLKYFLNPNNYKIIMTI